MIGSSVGNHQIVGPIGHGGMGVVYLAVHQALGRKAAVKILLPELSGNADTVRRFLAEAQATAQLRHPAFVEVFDSGTLPDGRAYLVMEHLRGDSLSGYLRRARRLPWVHALAVAREIAAGMAIAHKRGMVHRDLKPANVFLSLADSDGDDGDRPKMTVKILDFGIAKLTTPRE